MKTIFFIFRLILSPLKTIYSMLFKKNKKDNFIVKVIKTCFRIAFGFIAIIILVVILADESKDRNKGSGFMQFDYANKAYIKKEEVLRPDNPDGSVNGLNLQLIDSIQTEGFVKEYLTIARDLENGKLGQLNNYFDVLRILGVAATEQGTYPGTVLLGSPLPTDSSGIPIWDKSKDMTLSKAYREDYEKYGYTQSFVRAGNLTGDYFGPWQVAISYMSNGSLRKSILSKKSEFDYFHFRDQMYAYAQVRDWKYSSFDSTFNGIEASKGAKDMYVSIMYSGSPIYTYLYGSTEAEKLQSLEDVYKWTHDVLVKDYRPFLGNSDLTAGWVAKFISIMLNVKNGGKISQKTYNYATDNPQRGKCQEMLNIWGINKSVEDFLRPAVDYSLPVPGLSDGVISGMMSNIINGKPYYMIPESTGHYIGEEALGPYYYARMLQYAGVNVDPTNPNSYMNTLPEGEWKPGGDSVWMENEKVDLSKLDATGEKILNEAHKYLGLPYVWGGTNPNVGLDCSGYVQLVYRNALGYTLPRVTYDQARLGREVSVSEAKPGDLVFYYTTHRNDPDNCEHVAIYLGMVGDQPRIMHAPEPGDVIKFSTWDARGYYADWSIRRVVD